MTTTEGTQSNAESSAGEVSELEHAVNGVPVADAPTEEFDSAGPDQAPPPTSLADHQ